MEASTRICVKNVPRYVTDERLRDHFSEKGEVTDAKIMRTRDGRTRQFGFVGFRTAEEANEAVKYFHRTFFDTSRLSCEIAYQIGDGGLPRPWSRHSEGSSAFMKFSDFVQKDASASASSSGRKGDRDDEEDDSNAKNDPKLQEFLELMQPRSKSKIWADDSAFGDQQETASEARKRPDKVTAKTEQVDAIERRGAGIDSKKAGTRRRAHVRFEDGSESEEVEEQMEAGPRETTDILDEDAKKPLTPEQADLLNNEAVSDLHYLKSRVTANWSDDESESEDEDEDDEDEDEDEDDSQGLAREEQGNPFSAGVGHSSEGGDGGSRHLAESLSELNADQHEIKEETLPDSMEGTKPVSSAIYAENQESVSETGRLFVRNLAYTASEEDLTELFGKIGQLTQVHLVLDKETKRSKGFAYVLFMLPEDAVRAMRTLDRSVFQGRLLHILAAKKPPPPPESKPNVIGAETTKYKIERDAQRKAAEASGDTRAWNSLYMRPDTVAENVARKYGMTKSEFLDPEGGDLAVRMALGETHIIAETKRALNENGVNVEVLEEIASGAKTKLKRSDCVILVKNLPFTTSEDDLVNMFSAHGTVGRVILPPTKTLALVEYLEAAEARRAFKNLAYKRYQHVPLYLEWAPVNLLTDVKPQSGKDGPAEGIRKAAVGKDLVKRAEVEQSLVGPSEDQDLSIAQARSIFVKNLNFSTTQISLKRHFEQHIKTGSVRSATIKTKPSKNSKPLSMGFGFVEFDSAETAADVCKQLQGSVLDGHALVLQPSSSERKVGHYSKDAKKGEQVGQSSSKVIVRNVAFEATRKDLQQLFSPFGQIKSLRLPKKFDGNHRGFAFVEFMTKKEAANAFDGLKSTHLYGRHLVLERAKEGESLDELRARTAQQFFAENGVDTSNDRSAKKRKTSSP